jgi:hypothetical protein
VSAVTVDRAVAQLTAAVEDLWAAVSELALIVMEDQPHDDDGLAVADQLVETVSELQGSVAAARAQLAACTTDDGRTTITALPQVSAHLRAASDRYWRDLRGHAPVAHLRAGSRQRGGAWPSWRSSVEQSTARCAEPFDAVAAAVDAGWQEICQLALTPPGTWHSPSAPDPYRRIP